MGFKKFADIGLRKHFVLPGLPYTVYRKYGEENVIRIDMFKKKPEPVLAFHETTVCFEVRDLESDFKVPVGMEIGTACQEATYLAWCRGEPVRFIFNDVELIAHVDSLPEFVEEKYARTGGIKVQMGRRRIILPRKGSFDGDEAEEEEKAEQETERAPSRDTSCERTLRAATDG